MIKTFNAANVLPILARGGGTYGVCGDPPGIAGYVSRRVRVQAPQLNFIAVEHHNVEQQAGITGSSSHQTAVQAGAALHLRHQPPRDSVTQIPQRPAHRFQSNIWVVRLWHRT
jgi:hypothetical protein